MELFERISKQYQNQLAKGNIPSSSDAPVSKQTPVKSETETLLSTLSKVPAQKLEVPMPIVEQAQPDLVPQISPLNQRQETQPERAPASPSSNFDLGALLIGATPALVGLLTGEREAGFGVASDYLGKYENDRMALMKERMAAKNKQGIEPLETIDIDGQPTLVRRSEAIGKRKYYQPEKSESDKPLKESDLALTIGPDGKPVYTKAADAVGKTAFMKSSSGLSFEQRKELMKAKSDLEKGGKAFDQETKLRDKYKSNKLTQNTVDMAQNISKIRAVTQIPQDQVRGTDDISLVFSYMKLIDPGSVVRPSEQATAENAGAIPDNIRQMYNRLLLGKDTKLPDQVRKNFAVSAERLYDSQRKVQSQLDREYQNLASQYGLDPSKVVTSIEAASIDKQIDDMSEDELNAELMRMGLE